MMSGASRNLGKDMEFWYSSAEWKDIFGADEAETICVPPCLDIMKSWKRNDLDEAPHLATHIIGQKGEATFMIKFQELNMGGILVSGLEFQEVSVRLTEQKKVRKAKKSRKIQDGEWDAIFFHQNRGILVIEVKATETNDENIVNNRIEKAKAQLDRNIDNIKQSFLSLYQKECTCITGFICFPFRNEDRKTYAGYRIIDKSVLDDRSIFRQFFETQINETKTEVSLLHSFATEFVCCRSQVEFHSQAYNAMQVATWIMEQDITQNQDPTKLVNMPGNGPSGKIILTAQQLEIVECREKCVIIGGAPGSGKTLILMLRALKAAAENKAGSVFVFVNEKLKAKYEHYFFDEAENIIRRPKVQTIDKINFAKQEDDVFFDETPVEDSHIEKVKSRVNCSGSTTVVFTGLHKPGEAVASFLLYKPQLEQFKHFELMKVLRGTGNIFGKWEHYYPLGITMGHNIYGLAVKSYNFDSFEQVQNEIAHEIATLTNTNSSNTDLPSLKKEHIAVITCDDKDSTEIRNYFDMKGIPCGQVNEQVRRLKSTSLVAVDVYLNTPSYEWPIVFIVLKPGLAKEEVLPIAASRCIASLAIITYKKGAPILYETVDEYRKAAEQGDANAQKYLGFMYQTGQGVPQSYVDAVKWYRKSAEQGDAVAQFNLAEMYRGERGMPQADEETVKWYRKSAEQGYVNAQQELGIMYEKGRGVSRSFEDAVTWFRIAAEQGFPLSQNSLAYSYETGQGVPQSNEEAVKWLRKAVEQEYPYAQNNLGLAYENGNGVPQSDEEAVKLYMNSAEQGYKYAQTNLGRMYLSGRGVPQSDEEAVKWFRKAAEQGDAEAQFNLGLMYDTGRSVARSDAEAIKWYEKAAEQGDAMSQFNLGLIHQESRGFNKTEEEFVKRYQKMAEQGNANAQNNFGWMYHMGFGVLQSDEEALKWYRKAADQGNAGAQYNLGYMCRYGIAVPQSKEESLNWNRKAAEQGYALAKRFI